MHEAPRTDPVAAPLPPDLRPYLVLQSEPDHSPRGARFDGHWVTAWKSRLPCVQLDRMRCRPIGRTLRFASDGDTDAVAALLRDAAVFVAADPAWLEVAQAAATPTIWLADGLPGQQPAALARFGRGRLQVLHSDSCSRRDLPLRSVLAAVERMVPGAFAGDPSESALCRQRLSPWLAGRLADLGHGGHKILPHAVGVDFFKVDPGDWIGDVRDLWFAADGAFDTVYSSHCLEDLWHPHQALGEWLRVLAPGGHLALFLPLRDHYPNVGTPGANPGHKDDYVPEDVAGFLREIGGAEVVHAQRVEGERSFELVARRTPRKSFFQLRDGRPRPAVSVLVVGEVAEPGTGDDAAALRATVACAQAALAGIGHEILVLQRDALPIDERAALDDLAARDRAVFVLHDRRPLPYGQRHELLRRAATGDQLLVLASGALLDASALHALRAALADGARASFGHAVDAEGRPLPAAASAAACLLLPAAAWPVGAFDRAPYTTDLLWAALASSLPATQVEATVLGGGTSDRSSRGHDLAALTFDDALLARGAAPAGAPPRRILVSILRTLGDCVLATPALAALRQRHRAATIDVLTEQGYGWIFCHHPAVDAVVTVPPLPSGTAGEEDRTIAAVLGDRAYDALFVLSDRRDNVSYHHSGLTLGAFYASQVGLPEAGDLAPQVPLAAAVRTWWQQQRQWLGLSGRYAVLHTRGGWADKTPSPQLMAAVAGELQQAGLPVVVVGGAGETLAHPGVVQLAGTLGLEQSAAVIAAAAVFVGPDSGPLHLAAAAGVPSVALYGGSHLGVAPPSAPGSCAVQTAVGCAIPCGRTPCAEAACGAHHLAAGEVLPRVREVLHGNATANAWRGAVPARCLRHADGRWLLDAASMVCGALERAITPAARIELTARPTPAPVTHVQVRADARALATHGEALRQRRLGGAAPVAGHGHDVVDRILDALPPGQQLDVLRTMARQCRRRGRLQGALDALAAAVRCCGDVVHGQRTRARPAFRLHADALLLDAVAMVAPAEGRWEVRAALLATHRAATGRAIDAEAMLHALAFDVAGTPATAASRAPALALLSGLLAAIETPPPGLAAGLLVGLDEPARALAVLEQAIANLPPAARAERAQLAFQRGTLLCRDPQQLQAARCQFAYAAEHLPTAGARQGARQILGLLETHGNGALV